LTYSSKIIDFLSDIFYNGRQKTAGITRRHIHE